MGKNREKSNFFPKKGLEQIGSSGCRNTKLQQPFKEKNRAKNYFFAREFFPLKMPFLLYLLSFPHFPQGFPQGLFP